MKYPFLLSMLLLAGTGGAFGDSILVSPASQNVTIGQSVRVDVDIDNIPDVFDYQFSLTFNPTVLAAQSVTEGALFAKTGDSFFSPGTIDNVAGAITLVFDTLEGSTAGVAGPGTLASVQFEVLTASTTSIDFSPLDDLVLENSNGNTLALTPIPGSVHVVTTPEPATFYSLAPALVLIFFSGWRRAKRRAFRAS